MSDRHRIFGSELSPYSVKVRSYLRYKGIPHEWVLRDRENMAEFQQHARLPLIPLVLTPAGEALQDSTPIIEKLETSYPDPALQPADPTLAFLSALIEEYADEWVNKPMFHYRWSYEADQRSTAQRIARENLPSASDAELENLVGMIIERMIPRLPLVGSSPSTRDQIERSYHRQLELLEAHLERRAFLFGGRPALADFGLAAQLYECSTDPTPGALLEAQAPRTRDWTQRMLDPKQEGEFESWQTLQRTLAPLLAQEVGQVFLPWSDANSRALASGESEFSVTLDGQPFTQRTQKYHARSLARLRARYLASDRSTLDPILRQVNCLEWLV